MCDRKLHQVTPPHIKTQHVVAMAQHNTKHSSKIQHNSGTWESNRA